MWLWLLLLWIHTFSMAVTIILYMTVHAIGEIATFMIISSKITPKPYIMTILAQGHIKTVLVHLQSVPGTSQ